MWHLTACKISVRLSFLNWIKNEMIFIVSLPATFYRILSATLIQRYDKKSFHFKNQRLTEILQAVLIPYINQLNLSLIIKCLFLRNMEPLMLALELPEDDKCTSRQGNMHVTSL